MGRFAGQSERNLRCTMAGRAKPRESRRNSASKQFSGCLAKTNKKGQLGVI